MKQDILTFNEKVFNIINHDNYFPLNKLHKNALTRDIYSHLNS